MPLIGLSVNWTQLRKESLTLWTGQQKPPQLKSRKKTKTEKKKNRKYKNYGTTIKHKPDRDIVAVKTFQWLPII